ncbi:transmembrane prolyl 4-hydroxylase-like isoform X1 [Dendronephthya gigantea]|uniref:transmembrane prolyl 4-hydroxylase-like isoform X1 n=2 Tax=Dendronephthya gigantea TaxID=151771 RepID=UPI001069E1A5|nr:transmembrane prolyl 4-hydroxylase-like isoform X1 [Dendronephthya gigantea]
MVRWILGLRVLLCFSSTNLISNVDTSVVEEECPTMAAACVGNYYTELPLARRYPVEVGHITKLSLENEQIREMKTLSIKPPIFEIRNYMSPEECDDIIRLAKEQGLQTSETMDEDMFEDEQNFQEADGDVFEYYDYNKDNFLDVDEVTNLLDTELDFSPDMEDVVDMLEKLDLDKNGDLKLSEDEFEKKDVGGIIRFVSLTKRKKPYTKSRHSEQTWLETDRNSEKTLQSLRKRLWKLTKLPLMLLNASESLQVVSYGPRGHYNCHVDSDDIDPKTRCCHLDDYGSPDCRICRYLTVLYFLNYVEEGGETAFPIADNETYDEDVWQKDVKRMCNVGRNCHKSNLRVKPEKGKAILWYSHGIDDATGWLGDSDPYSVHGGCDVKKGRKWIANNWISVSESRIDDVQFWLRKMQNAENAETKSNDGKNSVFDEVFQDVESVNTKKEEEINGIFDSLEHSDVESTIETPRQEL